MKYTEKQIEELKQIKYVKNVTSKSIIFTLEAKIKALKMKENFLNPKEIFQKLGFPEYVFNSRIPENSLFRWSKNKNNFKNIILQEKIKNICLKFKRKYGYRKITMHLKNIENIKINHKKVLKIMKNNGILASIRRKNNISFGLKKSLENKICKNILNRDFSGKPFEKFGTDISYLHIKGKKYFLSILKDLASSEIISYEVSDNLGLDFVLNTIKKARKKINLNGKIIHSNQGIHYTNSTYQNLLKKFGVIQSVSRRGNCLDNAPTESFFGI